MKFGRRSFLQWTAGLVGGTLLSPLPWKLADDSAIWSQNWSWRPSPERGPITRVPTVCMLCDGGCGIEAKLVDGTRAIGLAGRSDHPINKGGICPLGAAGLQFLYAPYRIPKPLKQTRRRGDLSGFKPIGWEEALSELSGRLKTLRTEGQPHTVAGITGRRRSSTAALWEQFFTAYGSPNFFTMPSQDESSAMAARLSLGRRQPLAFALERADFILSFEANLIEGWGAPGRMQAVFGQWRQDAARAGAARLVQIEPRCSLTAAKADQWVAIRPGGSTFLAMAMAHVMIKESLYDKDFMATEVFGFDDWEDEGGKSHKGFRELALRSEHAPEAVAEATGVPAARIRELAREFATRKDAVAVWGESQGDLPGSVYGDLVFVALNALKGNLARGGLVSIEPSVPLSSLPAVELDETAGKGQAQKHLGAVRTASMPFAEKSLYPFIDEIKNGGPYPVNVLLVHEANPLYSLPENGILETALARIGMLVSFSSYMDETAAMADLVLPNHTAFERLDDVQGLPGVPAGYYAVGAPILKPQMDTRNAGDVILQLARGLGDFTARALPWKSYEAFLQERVKGLAESGRGAVAAGKSVDLWAFKAGDSVKPNFKDGNDLWKKLTGGSPWVDAPMDSLKEAPTPSGKLELALSLVRRKGVAVEDDALYLPHAVSLPPSGDATEFPLLLITHRSLSLSSGYLANPPFLTKTLWDTVLKGNESFAEIHPQTAQSLNVGEGDRVLVKTPQGQVTVNVHIFAGAPPGTIGLIQGLGHKAYDEYIADKGVNPNSVIEVQLDPLTGLGTFWAARAQVRRA